MSSPAPVWVPLGEAEPIHTPIIETAERTLGEVTSGARLTVRLTQLWKSLWLPLEKHLDPERPVDIAPVGMLHAVPWAVLRQRDGRLLCQSYRECRIPALTGKFPSHPISNRIHVCGTSTSPVRFLRTALFLSMSRSPDLSATCRRSPE